MYLVTVFNVHTFTNIRAGIAQKFGLCFLLSISSVLHLPFISAWSIQHFPVGNIWIAHVNAVCAFRVTWSWLYKVNIFNQERIWELGIWELAIQPIFFFSDVAVTLSCKFSNFFLQFYLLATTISWSIYSVFRGEYFHCYLSNKTYVPRILILMFFMPFILET